MHRPLTAIAVSAVALCALTACAGSNDDPEPAPSSSGPSVSPAPSSPTLNSTDQVAFDDGVRTYRQFRSLLLEYSSAPDQVDRQALLRLTTLATKDEGSSALKELQPLIDSGARTTGRQGEGWIVPVSVTSSEVVLRQCQTPGNWKLVGKDGKSAKQLTNTVIRAEVSKIDGRWVVSDTKGDGKC